MEAVIDQKQLAFRRGKITCNQILEMLGEKELRYSGRLSSTRLWGRAGGGHPGRGHREGPALGAPACRVAPLGLSPGPCLTET